MRRAFVLFSSLVVALVALAACSGDDTSSAGTTGTGGEGGNSCPTDNCGQCQAGQSCCQGTCVDLMSGSTDADGNIIHCGICCKTCPNQFIACTNGECVQ
jgi:hypothetical protein